MGIFKKDDGGPSAAQNARLGKYAVISRQDALVCNVFQYANSQHPFLSVVEMTRASTKQDVWLRPYLTRTAAVTLSSSIVRSLGGSGSDEMGPDDPRMGALTDAANALISSESVSTNEGELYLSVLLAWNARLNFAKLSVPQGVNILQGENWRSGLGRQGSLATTESVMGFIAWCALMYASLVRDGKLYAKDPNWGIPGQSTVPPDLLQMTVPGWHTNPITPGEVLRSGASSKQRFWDGSDWTDRIRSDDYGKFKEALIPLADYLAYKSQ